MGKLRGFSCSWFLVLDSAYVDIRAAREPGQAYVAVSRVRSLAGLHFKDWFEEVHVSPEALRFYEEEGDEWGTGELTEGNEEKTYLELHLNYFGATLIDSVLIAPLKEIIHSFFFRRRKLFKIAVEIRVKEARRIVTQSQSYPIIEVFFWIVSHNKLVEFASDNVFLIFKTTEINISDLTRSSVLAYKDNSLRENHRLENCVNGNAKKHADTNCLDYLFTSFGNHMAKVTTPDILTRKKVFSI